MVLRLKNVHCGSKHEASVQTPALSPLLLPNTTAPLCVTRLPRTSAPLFRKKEVAHLIRIGQKF